MCEKFKAKQLILKNLEDKEYLSIDSIYSIMKNNNIDKATMNYALVELYEGGNILKQGSKYKSRTPFLIYF